MAKPNKDVSSILVDHQEAAECALALADGCIAAGDLPMAMLLLRQAKNLTLGQGSEREELFYKIDLVSADG